MEKAHGFQAYSARIGGIGSAILMSFLAYATFLATNRLWRNPLLACSALLAIGLLMAYVSRKKGILPAYPIALITGTVFEIICISSGAWSYSSPDLMGIPLFLFCVWGNAGLYLLDTHRRLESLLGKTAKAVLSPLFVIAFLAIAASAVSFLWKEPFLLAGILFLMSGAILLKRGKAELAVFLFASLFGTLAEFASIANGLWSYPQVLFFQDWPLRAFIWIPIWLPFLWGLAALGFVELNEYLLSARFRRSSFYSALAKNFP